MINTLYRDDSAEETMPAQNYPNLCCPTLRKIVTTTEMHVSVTVHTLIITPTTAVDITIVSKVNH